MKQEEIITGNSYLFASTDRPDKKWMVGTIVIVVGRKKGGKKISISNGIPYTSKKPMRFKLSNGSYANAANLKPIDWKR